MTHANATVVAVGSKRARVVLPILALVALVIWTVVLHQMWAAGEGGLHAVPAFFLGAVLVILLSGFGLAVVRCWRWGWRRGLLSGDALKLVGMGLVLCCSVVALFYTLELWRGRKAMARVAKVAQEGGEPTELQALRPKPIPDQDNLAAAPLFAPLCRVLSRDRTNGSQSEVADLGPLRAVAEWGRRRRPNWTDRPAWMRGEPLDLRAVLPRARAKSGESAGELSAAVLKALQPCAEPVKELATIIDRPQCQFPWPEMNPMVSESDLQVEAVMAGFRHVLLERAVARLSASQPKEALEDLVLNLRLARHVLRLPGLHYAGPRGQLMSESLQPLWEALGLRCWSEAELARIQSILDELHPQARLAQELRYQALVSADLLESAIPTKPRLGEGLPIGPQEAAAVQWIRWWYPKGWSLMDQAAVRASYLDMASQRLARIPSSLHRERSFALELMGRTSDPFFAMFIVPKVAQMRHDAVEAAMLAEASVGLGKTACALERYRIRNGGYPESLEALAPDYIREVPVDPVSDGRLQYRRDGSGFVLYSVGLDGRDDGGAEAHGRGSKLNQGEDWVWAVGLPARTGQRPDPGSDGSGN